MSYLPFSMWRMMKYAVKHRAEAVSEIKSWKTTLYSLSLRILRSLKYTVKQTTATKAQLINWNTSDILASYNPLPYYFDKMKDAQCAYHQHCHFKGTRKPAFRLIHPVQHFFKRLVDSAKLAGNIVHTANNRGPWRSCQASGLTFGGLPLPGTLRMASRADLSYRASEAMGFMPSLNKRIFAVCLSTPSSLAISLTVKNSPLNFILLIIGKCYQRFNFKANYYTNVTQNYKLFYHFLLFLATYYLTLLLSLVTINYIGNQPSPQATVTARGLFYWRM